LPGTNGAGSDATVSDPNPRARTVLDGKYELLRLLGEGGMGTVYEARHLVLQRRCAVKCLRRELAHEPEAVKRFVREAQAASRTGHRGIIGIHDVGTTPEGGPYLVMELLEGRSLGAELAGGRKLPARRAAELAVQTLQALDAAHAAGIIHRDLKPENLFLADERDGPPTVRLLDFGVSRFTRGDGTDERMTHTGAVLGTPAYMAPEQAAGRTDIDRRLDIYAVGVILYQCLTGKLPFQGANYNQIIMQIATQPFPSARVAEPSIPPELDAVVLKAAAHDRERRFATAEEMARALAPFLAEGAATGPGRAAAPPESGADDPPAPATDSPQTATPPAAPARRTEPGRRGGFRYVAGFAAAAVAAGGLALALWRPWEEEPPGPDVQAAAPGPSDPAVASPARVAAAAEVVTVSFRELPRGAVVVYDGAYVAGDRLPVRRDRAAVVVEIEVPGRETYRQWVVPDRDIDVALPAPGAPPPAAARNLPPPAPRGTLEVELFQERIRPLRDALRGCFQEARERTPDLQGHATMRLEVDLRGVVTPSISVITPELDAAGVGPCLVQAFATMSFADRPPQGGPVAAFYPLHFRNQ
jgi:serine/threonine-protein kinase